MINTISLSAGPIRYRGRLGGEVRRSCPATTSRGSGAGSSSSSAKCAFHWHTCWENCRYTHFEIPLATGRLTVSKRKG